MSPTGGIGTLCAYSDLVVAVVWLAPLTALMLLVASPSDSVFLFVLFLSRARHIHMLYKILRPVGTGRYSDTDIPIYGSCGVESGYRCILCLGLRGQYETVSMRHPTKVGVV